MQAALERAWYRRGSGWTAALLPLAWLYGAVVRLRRLAYARGWLASTHPGVPVIVVGNLTVGGTGKTPLAAALATRLAERGRRPGIVSRGYGGRAGDVPQAVAADADPAELGDEPVLLARRAGCPVAVCRRRAPAARYLVCEHGVDVIVADDGLQHYALARDAEIAVRDAARGYGNGWLLPAGPLREPLSRLKSVDLELVQGAGGDFGLAGDQAVPVAGGAARPLSDFAAAAVHAVAGIGDPERFFAMLRAAGLRPIPHPFPDHHRYTAADLAFGDDAAVLMTEKDAVKCTAFAEPRHWYVPVTARLEAAAATRLDSLLERVLEPV